VPLCLAASFILPWTEAGGRGATHAAALQARMLSVSEGVPPTASPGAIREYHFARFCGSLATRRGWFRRLVGFGLRFRARGSQRPGRSPTRWYATALSSASTSFARCRGRAASSFGANAVKACLAP
jgi:hypothetical protein